MNNNQPGFISIIMIIVMSFLIFYTMQQQSITQTISEMIQDHHRTISQSYLMSSISDYMIPLCQKSYTHITSTVPRTAELRCWPGLPDKHYIAVSLSEYQAGIKLEISLYETSHHMRTVVYHITKPKGQHCYQVSWIP